MTGSKPLKEGKRVYSNLIHTFNMTEVEVKNSGKHHQHSAYDFCGYVWWDNEEEVFREEIWIYHSLEDRLSNPSLKPLIKAAIDLYGSK